MRNLIETLQAEALAIVAQARQSVLRSLQFPTAEKMIKVAVGMRRSGKTYFLYQTLNELLEQGVSPEQILMINFEDDRLLPMQAKEMGQLLDAFYSLYPQNHQRCCYLFLDEVQNVSDWHQVVRRYFDSKDVQLYLTGSSAKLLSKEINTSLRGRALAVEILPYSFQEYLLAQHFTAPKKPFGQAQLDVLQNQLCNYLALGGFPAVQQMPQNEWRETLQSYVDTVILRDIIERHGVTNVMILKYLITSLLKNAASPFSMNKFYNDVKSQGYKVSKDTLHHYLSYIEDACLVFTVPFYLESERLKQNRPKKIYVIDSGLVNAVTLQYHHNYGKLLENLVYLDLRRQKKAVYFYHTAAGYEIDFVTIDLQGQRELIQVTWDMADRATQNREQRALLQAEQELGIRGKIITAKDYLRDCSLWVLSE